MLFVAQQSFDKPKRISDQTKSIFQRGVEMEIKSIKVNKIDLLRSNFISAVSQYTVRKKKNLAWDEG